MEGSTPGTPETRMDTERRMRTGRETACFTVVLGISGSPATCTCGSALLSAGPGASPELVRRGGVHHFVLGGLLISFQPPLMRGRQMKKGLGLSDNVLLHTLPA